MQQQTNYHKISGFNSLHLGSWFTFLLKPGGDSGSGSNACETGWRWNYVFSRSNHLQNKCLVPPTKKVGVNILSIYTSFWVVWRGPVGKCQHTWSVHRVSGYIRVKLIPSEHIATCLGSTQTFNYFFPKFTYANLVAYVMSGTPMPFCYRYNCYIHCMYCLLENQCHIASGKTHMLNKLL